ncbi:MAG: hypothetical protein ACKVS9_09265 [Phycisphaerae bacterium]
MFARRTLASLAVAALVGCDRPAPAHRYLVLAGVVTACAYETGELAVTVSRRTAGGPSEEAIDCVVTKDSEIYVNGRFAQFSEIALRDAVTLIGYNDANPRSSRFVVSYAYFEHDAAADPPSVTEADLRLSSPQ